MYKELFINYVVHFKGNKFHNMSTSDFSFHSISEGIVMVEYKLLTCGLIFDIHDSKLQCVCLCVFVLTLKHQHRLLVCTHFMAALVS